MSSLVLLTLVVVAVVVVTIRKVTVFLLVIVIIGTLVVFMSLRCNSSSVLGYGGTISVSKLGAGTDVVGRRLTNLARPRGRCWESVRSRRA